jgi:hypothetical protein
VLVSTQPCYTDACVSSHCCRVESSRVLMAWRFSSSSLSFSSQCRPVATIKSLSQAPPPTQHSIASRAPRLLESLRRVRTGRLCPRRATQLSNHGDQESHTDLQCAPLSKRSGSQSAAFQFDFSPVLPFRFDFKCSFTAVPRSMPSSVRRSTVGPAHDLLFALFIIMRAKPRKNKPRSH